MYVLIDRENMVFRHKHPEHAVVSDLATIEVAHCAVTILPILDNGIGFFDFTDLELKLLYQNTTGLKFTGFSRLHLLELTLATARCLPVSDVKPLEVRQQAMKIKFEDSGFYRYTRGAYTAKRQEDLFEPTALVVLPRAIPDAVIAGPVAVPKATNPPPTAPVFTQPLPVWHPLYKAQRAGL
jgi:hypothetical protein